MISTTGKTLQQVSDEIAANLIEQGGRCMEGETCAYSDRHGNHCAIGWLLPEDSEAMEVEGNVCELLEHDLGDNQDFIELHSEALGLIQTLHDVAKKRDREGCAERLEVNYDLDMSAWAGWIGMGKEL